MKTLLNKLGQNEIYIDFYIHPLRAKPSLTSKIVFTYLIKFSPFFCPILSFHLLTKVVTRFIDLE